MLKKNITKIVLLIFIYFEIIHCFRNKQSDLRSRVIDFLGLTPLVTTSSGGELMMTYPNLSAYRTHNLLLNEIRGWLNRRQPEPIPPVPSGVIENIPQDFVTTRDGQGFISLRTPSGNYLSCDVSGNLSTSSQPSTGSLFVPEDLGGGRIGIRSAVYGYIGSDNENNISCVATSNEGEGNFTIMMSPGPNESPSESAPNYILLRRNSGGFLGVDENSSSNPRFYVNDLTNYVSDYLFRPSN